MTDRPKHHFLKLLPYGLVWGFMTGVFVHFVGSGFSWSSASTGYWITFFLIWALAGAFWAYLTSKFSKRKTGSEDNAP